MSGPDDATIHDFYTHFYAAAPHSPTHARFCARVYGRDLCQHGYTDMHQLDFLLDLCQLSPASHVLDLGCGTGQIAAYIVDRTGAKVHGIDNMAAAVTLAEARTASRRERLTFSVEDMHALVLAPGIYDTIIALDTLYYGDLVPLVGQIKNALSPGGQFAAFFTHILFNAGTNPSAVRADHTPLADALAAHALPYQTWDYTAMERQRSVLALEAATELKTGFAAENNLFLYENRLEEAHGNISFIDSGRASRYLYYVRF